MTLPTLTDRTAHKLFQTVLKQLPARLDLCPVWLDLHTTEISASVKWRWMDNSTGGTVVICHHHAYNYDVIFGAANTEKKKM